MDEQRDPPDAPPPASVPGTTRPAATLQRLFFGTLVGGILGIVATLVGLRVANRDRTPELTPQIFAAARERWKANAPHDYDIEVRVEGPLPAAYRARVRDGQAIAAWRNGKPLATVRTFGTWSVPGMFSTISRDVEALERRAAGQAPPGSPELILRAEFDPQFHYPRRYRRTEWGSRKGSTAQEVKWVVKEFRVLE
jgi:hypothetical protein